MMSDATSATSRPPTHCASVVRPTYDADAALAEAQARSILEVLRDGHRPNLVLVHRACAARLPGYPGTEAQQLCAEALHEYHSKEGTTSLNGYRLWLRGK